MKKYKARKALINILLTPINILLIFSDISTVSKGILFIYIKTNKYAGLVFPDIL